MMQTNSQGAFLPLHFLRMCCRPKRRRSIELSQEASFSRRATLYALQKKAWFTFTWQILLFAPLTLARKRTDLKKKKQHLYTHKEMSKSDPENTQEKFFFFFSLPDSRNKAMFHFQHALVHSPPRGWRKNLVGHLQDSSFFLGLHLGLDGAEISM